MMNFRSIWQCLKCKRVGVFSHEDTESHEALLNVAYDDHRDAGETCGSMFVRMLEGKENVPIGENGGMCLSQNHTV